MLLVLVDLIPNCVKLYFFNENFAAYLLIIQKKKTMKASNRCFTLRFNRRFI